MQWHPVGTSFFPCRNVRLNQTVGQGTEDGRQIIWPIFGIVSVKEYFHGENKEKDDL